MLNTFGTNEAAHCPSCGKHADNASSEDQKKPGPGDIAVCLFCATMCVFNDDMTLRELRGDEYIALPAEARMQLIRYRMAAVQAIRKEGA
jgi:hypothetical protein